MTGDLDNVRLWKRKDMIRSCSDVSVEARSEPRHVISLHWPLLSPFPWTRTTGPTKANQEIAQAKHAR